MQPLLDMAADLIEMAYKNEKKGLYYYAGLKYSQAWGVLVSVVVLRDSKTTPLSPKEEARLATLYGALATRLQSLQTKMGNGHTMSGKKRDGSPSLAVSALLEEVMHGF